MRTEVRAVSVRAENCLQSFVRRPRASVLQHVQHLLSGSTAPMWDAGNLGTMCFVFTNLQMMEVVSLREELASSPYSLTGSSLLKDGVWFYFLGKLG